MRQSNRSQHRSPSRPRAARTARVPACRCAGVCRCGGLVPRLLILQLERECEFYRAVL